jgi:hypothetical protein
MGTYTSETSPITVALRAHSITPVLHRILFFSLLLCFGSSLLAQGVEGFFSGIKKRLDSRDFIRINGGINGRAGLNFFSGGPGSTRRSQPFNWSAGASLNFDLLGIKAPFSAALSSGNTLYRLPAYSFYGISPTYKWITLHGGDRSMTFSPYSLSGINFRGAGVELKPGKFYFGAMSGELRRAQVQDAGSIQDLEVAYRRKGMGFKAGYEAGKGTQATISLFSSHDSPEKGVERSDSSQLDTPERNLVITIGGSHQLSKKLSFSVDWARTLLTLDDRSAHRINSGGMRMLGLFRPRTSTIAANAYKLQLGFKPSFGNLTFNFERVDPEYRTHGSLYVQNDLENFTVGFSAPLFDKKLNLSTNLGLQRNDLAGRAASNLSRFIGSANLSYAFSKRVNSTLGLSNFQSTNRYKALRADEFLSDSIVLAQTQQSLNLATTIALNAEATQTMVVSGNYQQAALIRNERVDTAQNTSFSMLMISYSWQPKGKGSLSGSLLLNQNITPVARLLNFGPSLAYSRKLFGDKGQLTTNISYALARTKLVDEPTGAAGGGIIQISLSGSYQLSKKQNIKLASSLVRVPDSGEGTGYTNGQLNLNYGLSF